MPWRSPITLLLAAYLPNQIAQAT